MTRSTVIQSVIAKTKFETIIYEDLNFPTFKTSTVQNVFLTAGKWRQSVAYDVNWGNKPFPNLIYMEIKNTAHTYINLP